VLLRMLDNGIVRCVSKLQVADIIGHAASFA
jgi:hypothetical protein